MPVFSLSILGYCRNMAVQPGFSPLLKKCNMLLITHYFFKSNIVTLLITTYQSNKLLYSLYYLSIALLKLVIVSFLLKVQILHTHLCVNVSVIDCSSRFKQAVVCYSLWIHISYRQICLKVGDSAVEIGNISSNTYQATSFFSSFFLVVAENPVFAISAV